MTLPYIGVVGTGERDEVTDELAEAVGRLLGERGAILVCGGLGGVMTAACRGATSAGGTTVALLPGSDRAAANPYVSVALPTGLGEVRNALIVRAVDGLIAVGGGYGTLSEIAFALKTGRPVVGLRSWELGAAGGVRVVETPREAVEAVLPAP